MEIPVESHLHTNVTTDWTLDNFQEKSKFFNVFYKENLYPDQNAVSKRPTQSTEWRGAASQQNEDLNSVLVAVGDSLTV